MIRKSIAIPLFVSTTLLGVANFAAADVARQQRVKDAQPSFQPITPGLRSQMLPMKLTNLVNLQYRYDGRLICLGYNGNIWTATDTDGDGLEDTAKLFWEGKGKVSAPIGMDLAPAGYQHGNAVFFACKGKLMMVTDKNNDDVADEARTIAEGWPAARAGVDTASVCFDPKDQSILFGLGVRWYDNAYEIDPQGKAQNDLTSERGAILRLSADFSKPEKLCTGVRWPVGLRFNPQGDLFCTDQEGATWLPNGNPFDELLHIQTGRHYGFPPQHPVHLPNVVDEPSVYDWSPQHQSTCGMRFNTANAKGQHFGPPEWKDDVFSVGESRGKLYRTKLVKTDAGYVAQNSILGCLNQLSVDLTFTPDAKGMLIATHSGEPDWGTGPEGPGAIFKLSYDEKSPALTSASQVAPDKFKLTFDKWSAELETSVDKLKITRGEYVRAGDRHETMWPGYEVIKRQHATPVDDLRATAVVNNADQKSVEISLPAQTSQTHYSISLTPILEAELEPTGIFAEWSGSPGQPLTLPHLAPEAQDAFLLGTPTLTQLQKIRKTAGSLKLTTRLDLSHMLQPRVQPGARLDHTPPAEEITLCLTSRSTAFSVKIGTEPASASKLGQVTHDFFYTTSNAKPLLDVEITLPTGPDIPHDLQATWYTKTDARQRAFPLRRFLLPWAGDTPTDPLRRVLPRAEIAGGDWFLGREVFHGPKAQCAACHKVRNQGKEIGPDLTNLTSRDYGSVRKDILEPSRSINPDYVTHAFALASGQTINAVRRSSGQAGKVILGIGAGAETTMDESDIKSATPLKNSLMPEGLTSLLSPQEIKNLMAFLLTEPPLVSPTSKWDAATQPELDRLLANAPQSTAAKPLKLVFVSGPKDHGPGEHDYPAWREAWSRLFTLAAATQVMLADQWPSAEQFATADGILFYRKGDWSAQRAADLDKFLAAGKGITLIHWSLEGGDAAADLAERIGIASDRKQTKYRHGMVKWDFDQTTKHPVTRNFTTVGIQDETYWNLIPSPQLKPLILATANEETPNSPQCWIAQPTKGGRVFVTLGGHYSTSFDNPAFRLLVLRGIAWSAGAEVDRFNNLLRAGLE